MTKSEAPQRMSGPGRRVSPAVAAVAGFVCSLGSIFAGVTLVRAADDAGLLARFESPALDRVARAVRVRERPAPSHAVASRPEPARLVIEPPTLERESDRPVARADAPRREPERPIVRAAEPDYSVARAAPRRAVERKARVRLAAREPRPTFVPASSAGAQTVCVRVCDGFAFPVGALRSRADIPIHRTACSAACPGAETALYTVPPGSRSNGPVAGARAVADGSPYRRLPNAFLFRTANVAACSCQGDIPGAKTLPVLLDPTLRAGDVVVDRKGDATVFAGGSRVPHSPRAFAEYRRSPAITRTAQKDVDRVMGTSQREAVARAFERTLRVREAAAAAAAAREAERAQRIRQASLREASAPAGSGATVRMYQVLPDGGERHASGARIVVIR